MVPNLPVSLAMYIPAKDHADAAAALMAHIEQAISAAREEAEDNLRRRLIAIIAGNDLEPVNDDARSASSGNDANVTHAQAVAAFHRVYPQGAEYIRRATAMLKPNAKLSNEWYYDLKAGLGITGRTRLLPAMLRELGYRYAPQKGSWFAPAQVREA